VYPPDGIIEAARIVFGGVADIDALRSAAEAALAGGQLSPRHSTVPNGPTSSRRPPSRQQSSRSSSDLAAKAGTRHLVLLSQLGSEEHSPVRFLRYHAAVEQHVRDLGIGYTFLRPNLYFQGLLTFAASISAAGKFFAPSATPR
jgi:uncharacterized protein YbjT (DUF2867 family)